MWEEIWVRRADDVGLGGGGGGGGGVAEKEDGAMAAVFGLGREGGRVT